MNLLFANENREQRERLTKLANAMTDEQLLLPLYEEGWTIATALGHLAFWDERRRVQLINWAKSGVKSSPIDGDTINDADSAAEPDSRQGSSKSGGIDGFCNRQ